MSNYTQITDFSAKDALTAGDPEKAISGADIDGEFSLLSTAIASKLDSPGVSISVKDAPYNATGNGTTDDTAAIQAAINAAGTSGRVYIPSGIYVVTQLSVDAHIEIYGDGGGIDDDRAAYEGSWLKQKDSSGLTTSQALLHITHVDTVSTTKRRFAFITRIGIDGNKANNTNGNGILVTAKNVKLDKVTVLDCATSGIVATDLTGAGNDGMNSSIFTDLWVGYNGLYGLELLRPTYSGDLIIYGGHYHWNEDAGIFCDQLNVTFIGVHVWWNLDGIIFDGTNGGNCDLTGVRIYDNAAAGIRLINSVKSITIAGHIHGNGNEARWAFYSPVKDATDIPQIEQSGIFCATDATHISLADINFGYLKDTLQQYAGLHCSHADAEFSIGTIVSDGASSTQWNRTLALQAPAGSALHSTHIRDDMTHPGFVAADDINMNGSMVAGVDGLSFSQWDVGSIAANVLTCTSTTMVLSEGTPATVTDLTVTAIIGNLPMIVIRNDGAGAVTFTHNTAKLRNISLADVVLARYEAIGYIEVSTGVFQQVMGK